LDAGRLSVRNLLVAGVQKPAQNRTSQGEIECWEKSGGAPILARWKRAF